MKQGEKDTETRGNAIKPVVREPSCCQIFDILNSKSPKTGMPKRQMLSICRKEEYSVAELTDIQNELR